MRKSSKTFRCVTQDGLTGKINFPKEDEGVAQFHLDDGEQIEVPVSLLQKKDDKTYFLPVSLGELKQKVHGQSKLSAGEKLVIPVIEEELAVGTRQKNTGGVRVTKHVHTQEQEVDQPGYIEEVEVERIPLNQELDNPAEVRQEGDTTIIPVMEEVLVLEKRLVLREEVRVTRRKREIHDPQKVVLRREEVIVDRIDEEPENGNR